MRLILIAAIVVLLILFISTKIGLMAYVAWMEENKFPQPSTNDMQRLIRWCAKRYAMQLFGKTQ